jgi:heme/copper-type cytochrome/quinol oxidase subunit 4
MKIISIELDLLIGGSKHVTRSQKRHKMFNIISQNQTFIFLLPFKTIVIMVSLSFFLHMNVKELKVKIHLI